MKFGITEFKDQHRTGNGHVLLFLLLGLAFLLVGAVESSAQQDSSQSTRTRAEPASESQTRVEPVRTESPRQTFSTLLTTKAELERSLLAYREDKNWQLAGHIEVLMDQLTALIDLSSVPRSSRIKRVASFIFLRISSSP